MYLDPFLLSLLRSRSVKREAEFAHACVIVPIGPAAFKSRIECTPIPLCNKRRLENQVHYLASCLGIHLFYLCYLSWHSNLQIYQLKPIQEKIRIRTTDVLILTAPRTNLLLSKDPVEDTALVSDAPVTQKDGC